MFPTLAKGVFDGNNDQSTAVAADPLSLLNDDEKVAKPQEEEEEEGDIEVKLAQLEGKWHGVE